MIVIISFILAAMYYMYMLLVGYEQKIATLQNEAALLIVDTVYTGLHFIIGGLDTYSFHVHGCKYYILQVCCLYWI